MNLLLQTIGLLGYAVLTLYCLITAVTGTWIWGTAVLFQEPEASRLSLLDHITSFLCGAALPTLPIVVRVFPNLADNTYMLIGMVVFGLAGTIWLAATGYITYRIMQAL